MNHTRLLDIEKLAFGRGWIFRCNKAAYPYESKVEFILSEEADSPSGLAFMVISGYKAGCTLVHLPKEALIPKEGIGKQWLIDNWSYWIYPECPIEDILIFRNELV